MTREEYLRGLILDQGTVKDFALKINMPYSTLLSILKKRWRCIYRQCNKNM